MTTPRALFFIPCLEKRDAGGTIELGDGQTMGLAGLINENLREVVTKFPGLGSVPVLGALFRSQQFRKGERSRHPCDAAAREAPARQGAAADRQLLRADRRRVLLARAHRKHPTAEEVRKQDAS